MKRVWTDREGVSPVIATILMVAITVVLAGVLYVMVMGFIVPTPPKNPITGTAVRQSATLVSVSITYAPPNAAISGSSVVVMQTGTPQVVNAKLFSAGGTQVGWYANGAWVATNLTATNYVAGMTMSLYGTGFADGNQVEVSGGSITPSIMQVST